jgi:hypothetical protein
MKNLRTTVLCLCITVFSLGATAQTVPVNEPDYNKPSLFSHLPGNIPVSIQSLNALLESPIGSNVSITLSEDLRFVIEGQVVSAASKYENTMQSIVIRSTNFPGARLTFTRVTTADRSATYTGRIISMQHGDLYELQSRNGQFILIKKKFYDLVNE